ncbi:MAG: tetratricopeptide repeat protein [Prochlorotrichaceae cyanobacterium]
MILSSTDSLLLNSYLMLHRSTLLLQPTDRFDVVFLPEIQWRDINIVVVLEELSEETEDPLARFVDQVLNDRFSAWVSWIFVGEIEVLEELEFYFNFLFGSMTDSDPILVDRLSFSYLPISTCWQQWESLKRRFNAVLDPRIFNTENRLDTPSPQALVLNTLQSDWTVLPVLQLKRGQTIVETLYNDRLKNANESKDQAIQFFQTQQWSNAIQAYQTAIYYNPFIASFWADLGSALFQVQRYAEAKAALQKAIGMDFNSNGSYYSLGLVEEVLENWDCALQAYQHAIDLNPQHLNSYVALGGLLARLRQWEAAEAIYRDGLAESIWHFGLYLNLGNLLAQTDRPQLAIQTYQKALQLSPNNAEVFHNLTLVHAPTTSEHFFYQGQYFTSQKDYPEAIRAYQRSLAIDPTHFASAFKLCECYHVLKQTESVRSTVTTILPHLANQVPLDSAHLKSLLLCLNKQSDSHLSRDLVKNLRFFKTPEIQNLLEQINFPILYANAEEIPKFRAAFETAIDAVVGLDFANPVVQDELFSFFRSFIHAFLNYQGENDREIQTKCATIVETLLVHRYPHWQTPVTLDSWSPPDKIRIGYASYYLRRHNGARWALGWIQHHDREKFEVFTYHFGENLDGYTKAFANASTEFKHLAEEDFETFEEWFQQTVQTIKNDRLQILIFPDLGMEPRTYMLSKLRLAPIQCTAWGHPVTSGSACIDYYLSSHLMELDQAQDHYRETLVRLPHLGLCYATPQIPENAKNRSFFQLPEDRILYLSCQSLFKYLPQYDDLYPAIAQQVPNAYFVFLETFLLAEKFSQRLEHSFSQFGLSSQDYCQILPKQSWESYLQLQQVADIYLDTIAWNGGNSTLEAIACGLPVVTYPGSQMRSRHSAAILQRLGVTETIAHSWPEYVEIAVELGKNPQWRTHIQTQYQHKSSRLFDDRQVTQSLNQVLLSIIDFREDNSERVSFDSGSRGRSPHGERSQ